MGRSTGRGGYWVDEAANWKMRESVSKGRSRIEVAMLTARSQVRWAPFSTVSRQHPPILHFLTECSRGRGRKRTATGRKRNRV